MSSANLCAKSGLSLSAAARALAASMAHSAAAAANCILPAIVRVGEADLRFQQF